MGERLNYVVFEVPSGWMAVLASAKGLVSAALPQKTEEAARLALGVRAEGTFPGNEKEFAGLVERFRRYFSGEKVAFDDEVDISEATAFRQEVWRTTRQIPWGETRSYLWVAARMGRPEAARAAGQALGRNPLPVIVPCHRVVASDGSLGGFTGGLDVKRRLLGLESASDVIKRG